MGSGGGERTWSQGEGGRGRVGSQWVSGSVGRLEDTV